MCADYLATQKYFVGDTKTHLRVLQSDTLNPPPGGSLGVWMPNKHEAQAKKGRGGGACGASQKNLPEGRIVRTELEGSQAFFEVLWGGRMTLTQGTPPGCQTKGLKYL